MIARKNDKGKVRFDLIPAEELEEIAFVLTKGAELYGVRNYLNGKGLQISQVYSAAQRHLNKYYRRMDKDPQFGASHLAHAACCILMLMELTKKATNDDRPGAMNDGDSKRDDDNQSTRSVAVCGSGAKRMRREKSNRGSKPRVSS